MCDISYTERVLKKINFTGSGLEGAQKVLKASRDYFYVKTMRHSKFQLEQFFPTDFKFGSFIAK